MYFTLGINETCVHAIYSDSLLMDTRISGTFLSVSLVSILTRIYCSPGTVYIATTITWAYAKTTTQIIHQKLPCSNQIILVRVGEERHCDTEERKNNIRVHVQCDDSFVFAPQFLNQCHVLAITTLYIDVHVYRSTLYNKWWRIKTSWDRRI